MQQVSDTLGYLSDTFDNNVHKYVDPLISNQIVLAVLTLFLTVYVTYARPNLPKFIVKLFENPVFRLVIISYIVYRANHCATSALMIAAAFLITMHMINKQKLEKFYKEDNDEEDDEGNGDGFKNVKTDCGLESCKPAPPAYSCKVEKFEEDNEDNEDFESFEGEDENAEPFDENVEPFEEDDENVEPFEEDDENVEPFEDGADFEHFEDDEAAMRLDEMHRAYEAKNST